MNKHNRYESKGRVRNATGSKIISVEELDRRFDAGENVEEFFDNTKAIRINQRGGRRIGAGRKRSGRLQITLRLRPEINRRFHVEAKRRGISLSALAEEKLAC